MIPRLVRVVIGGVSVVVDLRPPAPPANRLLTESGSNLITESGDAIAAA